MQNHNPSAELAEFVAGLRFEDIPENVVRKAEELLVDWFGSAVAGHGARPVETITRFAARMGPGNGPSEIIVSRSGSSPFFAAMSNAAASHFVEQDDVHNGSVFHPATVVFPASLAAAQAKEAGGRDFLTAVVAGYEAGIRIGEFLGRSHYSIFHTTGTAGTLAAAAACGKMLGLDKEQMLHAFGSAGTQSAGLWEFLRDAADSKQLHTAHAASAGLMSAYLAQAGFTGAKQILEGERGLAAGTSRDADASKLTEGLGSRWATVETSFKYHASCRHTHPAADALLKAMADHRIQVGDIARITAGVHRAAIDVLGSVTDPGTVHQSKFSMGTVLALAARYGHAGLEEFQKHYADQATRDLCRCVDMVLDEEVDKLYPKKWVGKIRVQTKDGRTFDARVDDPKGDPGNTLTRDEITSKAMRLARFSGGASESEMKASIERLWRIAEQDKVGRLLPPSVPPY